MAIIGAGGIGFDVAEFLLHTADAHPAPPADAFSAPTLPQTDSFLNQWGINPDAMATRGGLLPSDRAGKAAATRKIYLLQRKKGKLGAGLGKTTGWIHRATLQQGGVEMIGEAE